MTPPLAPAPGRIVPPLRTLLLLGLLVAVGFIVRIDALRNTAPPVPALGDARAYHLLGANLADGKGYIRPYEAIDGYRIVTAEYPPALPVVLAVATKVGVGGTEGQRVLLCGVGALTVGLVGLIGRRLSGADAPGYLAAAIAAVHPGLWNSDVSLMAEPLAAFTSAALVLGAIAAIDRPATWRIVGLGVLSGLGGLVRSELLLVGLVLVAIVVWLSSAARGRRNLLRRMGLGLAGVGVVLVPWTLRNLVAFDGRFVPLTNNSGSVAKGANCDAAYGGQFLGLWVTNVSLDGLEADASRSGCFSGFDIVAPVNEAERAAVLRSDGISYMRVHVDEVPKVMAARVGRTVGLYQLEQQSNFAFSEGRNAIWDRRGTRSFQILTFLGVVGLGLAARRGASRQRWLLLVPLVCSLAVVAVTYGNPRFRAAAEPMAAVLAALGIGELVRVAQRAWSGQEKQGSLRRSA